MLSHCPPCQALGWALCCLELCERAEQWQAAGKGHSLAGLWSVDRWSAVEMASWCAPSLEHSKFWRVLWLMGCEGPWELTNCGGVEWGIALFPWSSSCAGSCYCWTTALLLSVLKAAAHTAPQWEWSTQGKGWVKKEEEMTRRSQEKTGAAEKHRGCKVQRWKGRWKAEGSRAAMGRSGKQSGWRTWKLQGMTSFMLFCRDNSRFEYN